MSETMKQVETLRAACCVAGLDQNVDDKERQLLQKLADRVGVGTASLEAMISRAEHDHEFQKEQFEIIKTDPDHTVKVLLMVAMADGDIADPERDVIAGFADRLGMELPRYEHLLSTARKHLETKR
jgi:tellurite resistance protein